MDQKLVCTSNGRSGGLVLFWNNHINVRRIALDTMFIDVIIEDNSNNSVWHLTGMYCEFRWENKI